MSSITLNDVDKLPANTTVYIVENFFLTICNEYENFTIHGDLDNYPIYEFLKDTTGNLVSVGSTPIEIIDNGDGSESSSIEDPKFRIFLTEREALTWYYKSLLKFQENVERSMKKYVNGLKSFVPKVAKTEYMQNHFNSYPEDFI